MLFFVLFVCVLFDWLFYGYMYVSFIMYYVSEFDVAIVRFGLRVGFVDVEN